MLPGKITSLCHWLTVHICCEQRVENAKWLKSSGIQSEGWDSRLVLGCKWMVAFFLKSQSFSWVTCCLYCSFDENRKVNLKKIAGDNKRHQEAIRWSLHLNKFLESTLSRVDLQIELFSFVMRLIMNCINALAACCHFSIFLGSFLYQRANLPRER